MADSNTNYIQNLSQSFVQQSNSNHSNLTRNYTSRFFFPASNTNVNPNNNTQSQQHTHQSQPQHQPNCNRNFYSFQLSFDPINGNPINFTPSMFNKPVILRYLLFHYPFVCQPFHSEFAKNKKQEGAKNNHTEKRTK